MNKNKFISVEDLMNYLEIADWKKFHRLIKNNQLPQISRSKEISRKDADKIALELRGKRVDWYKIKQLGRDFNTGGPLYRKRFFDISDQLEDWYSRLKAQELKLESLQLPILGIVCAGGFLRGQGGSSNEPFILPLQAGINAFIGDRGSGKSTALSLLTLLADSTSERANVLINAVLDLLQGRKSTAHGWTRRIWNTLNQYGVNTYVCYFHNREDIYAFYININKEGFELLRRNQDNWISFDGEFDSILPKMQVLRQGDVFRIADDDEQLVLNNILDGLYPELHQKRQKLAHQVVNLANRYKSIKDEVKNLSVDKRGIDNFLTQHPKRLKELQILIPNSRRNVLLILNAIEDYILEYEKVDLFLSQGSIYELLQSGRDAMFCLYIGRISEILRKKISKIRSLLDNNISNREQIEMFQNIESKNVDYKKQDWNLVSQTVAEIFEFLENRISVARKTSNYFDNLLEWNSDLNELALQYISFLKKQSELIQKQESYCSQVSSTLKQENLDINLFTYKANIVLEQNQEISRKLKKAKENFEFLLQAGLDVSHVELTDRYESYSNSVEQMFADIAKIVASDTSIDANKDFIFHPVKVELRQGNSYHSFNHLSFGQKSGIILMIAIWMTKADIIVIDQPEDNLDSQSIIYMLAPTLCRVSQKRSVIIATHNSNLVMGLDRLNFNIFVMASHEEFGHIRTFGNLFDETVVRQILDVLEGGVETFEQKLKLYDEFVNLFPQNIQKTDISLIESSYRRRTIDSLRNYLQPVVSDRFILKSLRHELRNLDHNQQTWFQQTLNVVQSEIDLCNKNPLKLGDLLQNLNSLLEKLDDHFNRVTNTIEQIRLMETQPHPKRFEIYPLLVEEVKDLSENRQEETNFNLSKKLQNITVYADENHTRLVFRNLFQNAIRATEEKAANCLMDDHEIDYIQIITVDVVEKNPLSVAIQVADNGIGIQPDIREKLYVERCTTHLGREEHGYGGIIVRKLLDINKGAIHIIDTRYNCQNSGTIQKIVLPTNRE